MAAQQQQWSVRLRSGEVVVVNASSSWQAKTAVMDARLGSVAVAARAIRSPEEEVRRAEYNLRRAQQQLDAAKALLKGGAS